MTTCLEIADKIKQSLEQNQLMPLGDLKQLFYNAVKYIKATAEKEFQLIMFYETIIKSKNVPIEKLDI